MKDLFVKYQKPLLKLANNRFGRIFLGANPKEKIVGITDNAFAVRDGDKIKAEFRCYPVFAKRIGVSLSQWDIAKEWLNRNVGLYKGLDEYRGLLNYCGLLNTREFPTVMLASGDPIYSDNGDGVVGIHDYTPLEKDWATTVTDSVGNYFPGGTSGYFIRTKLETNYTLIRSFFPFQTSELFGVNLLSATFNIYGKNKDTESDSSQYHNLYSSSQDDPTQLVAEDYDQIGSTAFSTAKLVSGLSTSAYTVFTLNNNGLDNINQNGWSGFSLRPSRDYNNSAPSEGEVSSCQGYFSEQEGVDKDPKLIVVYTVPPFAGSSMIFGGGIAVS